MNGRVAGSVRGLEIRFALVEKGLNAFAGCFGCAGSGYLSRSNRKLGQQILTDGFIEKLFAQ